MEKAKKRMNEIDMAKGAIILLVIIGHLVPFDGSVFKWIFSFHMPFFFFVSGYCTLENKKFSLLYTAKKLLIPSLIVRSIFILRDYFVIESYTDEVYWLFISPASEWFFATMFLSLLIMQIYIKLDKLFKSKLEKMVFAGLCIALSFYGVARFVALGYHATFNLNIPFKIDSAFLGFVFILIGWWIRNRIKLDIPNRLSKSSMVRGALIGIILAMFSIKNSYVNMADGSRGISDTYYVFSAIYWIMIILIACNIYVNRKALTIPVSSEATSLTRESWLIYLGKRTNFIYPAHMIINNELVKIFRLCGYEFVPMISLPWYMIGVYFFIDLIVIFICLKALDQIKRITGKAWQVIVVILTMCLIGGVLF